VCVYGRVLWGQASNGCVWLMALPLALGAGGVSARAARGGRAATRGGQARLARVAAAGLVIACC